jgi:cytoskeletal protein CcmA (bactofilin family)
MFGKDRGTVIAEGLKIVGSVTAEGLVEVNGHIEGDMHCTSLVVAPQAFITGGIQAERVVVNGRVEGPIHGGEVILKSRAHVVGDIQHKSLAIEKGAFFDGRSVQTGATNGHPPEVIGMRPRREVGRSGRETIAAPSDEHGNSPTTRSRRMPDRDADG